MFSPERDDRVTGGVGGFGATESERRIADVIAYGVVKEADYSKSPARLRVLIGDENEKDDYILTGWLPMMTGRTDEWNPLRVGEAVRIVSASGELQNGVVCPAAINNQDHPNVGDKATLWRKQFKDGAVFEYDEDEGAASFSGKTRVTLKVGDASISIEAGKITISAETVVIAGKTYTGMTNKDDTDGQKVMTETGPALQHWSKPG